MILETARDFFAKLRSETGTEEDYVDAIWRLRYPNPSPKSSNGWPCSIYVKNAKPKKKSETGPKLDHPKVRVLHP